MIAIFEHLVHGVLHVYLVRLVWHCVKHGMEWNGIDWSVAHYFEIYFRNNSSPPKHSNGKTE